jgi:hypothetical protein
MTLIFMLSTTLYLGGFISYPKVPDDLGDATNSRPFLECEEIHSEYVRVFLLVRKCGDRTKPKCLRLQGALDAINRFRSLCFYPPQSDE